MEIKGKTRRVSTLMLVDDTGARLEVSVWDAAHSLVKDIPLGEGRVSH